MSRRDPTPISVLDFPAGGTTAAAAPVPDLEAALRDTDRLRRVALRITRDAAAAEDVVQSALEQALRHRGSFRGDAKPSTWLHRIVVNQALMWYRGEARRSALRARLTEAAGADLPERSPQPLDALLARERCESVQRALLALRPEDLGLIRHCALEGRSYASWARAAGIHATAAKTRAFRARRALRTALEDEDTRAGVPDVSNSRCPRKGRASHGTPSPSSREDRGAPCGCSRSPSVPRQAPGCAEAPR